ncbi:MAG: DUF4013 domain-containing protein [Candidatus Dormibacteraeota bacterium]|nr:DUF4013 domain-containing protein [Candidatus Dormibacteraeota bacterium]
MDRVAGSFGFPFRRGAGRAWLIGVLLLLLLPLGLVPLLGYTVAVVRSAAADPEAGPPPWRPLPRLLSEGLLLAVVIAGLTAPFALLALALSAPAGRLLGEVADPVVRDGLALVISGAVAALPWGILLLVLMPPATARLARSGRHTDLLDVPAALRTVRRRFPAWNLAVVAIVTAWAIGLSGVGLLLVGVVPGVLYAMLVSAHATASLADA